MIFLFLWVLGLSFTISLLIMLLGYSLSRSGETNLDKLSPFECGFNPNASHRKMFSLHFFLVSLVFLVFDLELVILFPFLSVGGVGSSVESYLSCVLFLFVLGLGLLYEWLMKSLEWCD
ncbi:NADH dehydrogenase subunit 3 (mitochondrion) [Lepeophtheirus salmonis]|uniref:NADH-ubiquinone oxidoreductase chain 3 n=1 Tax=Lepeophtheirus salmonis TaxID=72036 RepID=A0A1M4NFJ3_LEPSM|nr:NADH dehydrogenase subunit 3 [Lepeophtheirus salmonis]CAF3048431.1 NADH dehydrogenase subunit 3 [Lepeophtheirus salmonis]CAG9585938.1 NADH dehydrogenase subunit 3 [Lepeophtheirus salmonis]CAH1385106.1 NADH dehydrogenase subunit 3 [Lepeophtheirus salmonis]SFW10607.1 NADH dehydrogenase subunit 3 [Lepeophtheirus salmonis]